MSDIYKLTLDQVEKAGIKTEDNKQYFLSIPPVYNSSIKPFIYSTLAQVIVEKELTIAEAFAL